MGRASALKPAVATALSAPRLGAALLPMLGVTVAWVATRPFGPLAGTMLLVTTLPPLAASLEALGWAKILATAIRRARLSATRELMATYAIWLAASATFTLDVSAVVAVPIGLRLAAGQSDSQRRAQLGAAVLGSNVGSLLFPFSNLTNLILVSATGISFAAYLAAAWLPQLVAAVFVGALLVRRQGHRASRDAVVMAVQTDASELDPQDATWPTGLTLVGGALTVAAAACAVAIGLAGGDVAPVFALAAALVAACAIGSRPPRIGPRDLLRSIPPSGIAIVAIAAAAVGPLAGIGSLLPHPNGINPPLLALPVIAAVGGLLAITINNLPAAAFGAIWLVGGSPAETVAFLIGTNFIAIATPHGSLATILSQRLASAHGVTVGPRTYVATAWRYALAASLPALSALLIVPRW